MDHQNGTAAQTLKMCEALAFRFPLAMMRAFGTIADISAAEMQLWWRAASLPAGALLAALGRQRPGAAEVDALTMEIEQIRAELRAAAVQRRESEDALSARFDRLRDEIAALRKEFNAVLAQKSDRAEIDRLQAELSTLRQELRNALAEREAAHAATLAGLEVELRALRDRMDSPPGAEPESTPAKSGRQPNDESPRRRPRR